MSASDSTLVGMTIAIIYYGVAIVAFVNRLASEKRLNPTLSFDAETWLASFFLSMMWPLLLVTFSLAACGRMLEATLNALVGKREIRRREIDALWKELEEKEL